MRGKSSSSSYTCKKKKSCLVSALHATSPLVGLLLLCWEPYIYIYI
jgi:hypothetical protein